MQRTVTKTTKQLATTAHHEAGHAVACIFARGQRISFRQVSIVPDDAEGSLGRVLQKHYPAWLRREWQSGYPSPRAVRAAENQAVVLLAGRAAAARHRGRGGSWGSAVYCNDPEHGRVIVAGDVKHAVDHLDLISTGDPEETELLFPLADYRARRLVEARWQYIGKLAAELLARRALTEREVDEVLFGELREAAQ